MFNNNQSVVGKTYGNISYIQCKQKAPNYWKKDKHYRSMVYYPYFYVYYDYPYWESKYIKSYNEKYQPPTTYHKKIKLQDGTIIEGFGHNRNIFIFIFLLIAILILYFVTI